MEMRVDNPGVTALAVAVQWSSDRRRYLSYRSCSFTHCQSTPLVSGRRKGPLFSPLDTTGHHLSAPVTAPYDRTVTGLGDAPAYVKALPPTFRRQIAKQCDGDWRRVTLDDDGGVTVHNSPQREDIATEVAAVVLRSASTEPPPEPPPPSLQVRTQIPRNREVDTTGFTRIELPAAGPRAKRVAKKKPPPPLYPPIKEPDPSPGPVMVGQIPLSVPLSRRRDYGQPEFSVGKPAPRPGPPSVRPTLPPAVAPQRMRGRTGVPRTGFELLKRLLDLGCTYERLPASPFAKVYWEGQTMGLVTCADSSPAEQVLKDFRRCKRQIWKLKGSKTEGPRGGKHPGSSVPTTGNQTEAG